MSTMTKVFVVLNTVLSIALSVLFIAGASQWGNWKDLVQTYQTARDAAITHRQNTEATMNAALALKDEAIASWQGRLQQTEAQLADAEQNLAGQSEQLALVTNKQMAAEAARTTLQEILNVQTGELKSVQKQNQSMLAQNMDLQARNSRLNSRVLELTTDVTILTDELRNMQEKLYAAQGGSGGALRAAAPAASGPDELAVAMTRPPAVAGEIRGEVIEVNNRYASINVGEAAGVTAGMTFMVYRGGGEYVADLTVEKVRPRQAGGRLSTMVQGNVRAGDQVIFGIE